MKRPGSRWRSLWIQARPWALLYVSAAAAVLTAQLLARLAT